MYPAFLWRRNIISSLLFPNQALGTIRISQSEVMLYLNLQNLGEKDYVLENGVSYSERF